MTTQQALDALYAAWEGSPDSLAATVETGRLSDADRRMVGETDEDAVMAELRAEYERLQRV